AATATIQQRRSLRNRRIDAVAARAAPTGRNMTALNLSFRDLSRAKSFDAVTHAIDSIDLDHKIFRGKFRRCNSGL
ncbi:MAG: hypothetical protein ACREP7_03760, partial [Lysobacter sp.]